MTIRLLLIITFASAVHGQMVASAPTGSPATESHAPAPQAGGSFETAVVIVADNDADGVKAEYAWIKKNIPGGRPAGQALLSHNGKMFDLIHVKLPDDSVRDVYFDITAYFGKM